MYKAIKKGYVLLLCWRAIYNCHLVGFPVGGSRSHYACVFSSMLRTEGARWITHLGFGARRPHTISPHFPDQPICSCIHLPSSSHLLLPDKASHRPLLQPGRPSFFRVPSNQGQGQPRRFHATATWVGSVLGHITHGVRVGRGAGGEERVVSEFSGYPRTVRSVTVTTTASGSDRDRRISISLTVFPAARCISHRFES